MSSLKKANVQIRINTSAGEVWKVIHDDFANVANYNPMLVGSHHVSGEQGVGCERQCDLKPGGKSFIQEKIIKVVHEKYMEVIMSGGQFPMMKMDTIVGTYDLEELSNYTNISLSMAFEANPKLMGGIIKSKMEKMLFKSMIGLKYYVETSGQVTKNNFSKIEKLYYKMASGETFSSKIAA